jgi:hypothetical protein
MKTLLTTIALVLFLLSSCKTYSQTANTNLNHLELLKSRTWNTNELLKVTTKYTDTEVLVYVEGELIGSTKYHLSDKNTIDASYDPTKVGLVKTGRWIFYGEGKSIYYEFLSPTKIKFISEVSTTIVDAVP